VHLARQCAEQLYENRKHKGLSREAADTAIADPLLFAALLVKTGFVDAGVAGSISTTPSIIRAALYGIGTVPGRKTVSSFFLMQLKDRAITYSDCGVVPDPNAAQLAEIAIAAAASHQSLTGEVPKVALLSFSTKGSADHPRISKIREALVIVKHQQPDLCIDGELQFDAAFVPAVATQKAPASPVAGQANVFIFPDLDSGNIAYKITERLAGATALGPLLQGLARPFMDLSRGCSANDIIDVAVIASVLASVTNRS
jgi:phosphate acetyltransferase